MFTVGSGLVGKIDVVSAARSRLMRLAEEAGETVHLVVRDGTQVVYVFKSEGPGMTMSSRIGLKMPLYCTGVGKAILAGLPHASAAALFVQSQVKARTPATITSWDTLEKQPQQVKKRGWALDDEENEMGIRCVASALQSPLGGDDVAFSVSGIKATMDDARVQQLAQLCLAAKADIQRDIGV